VNFEPGHSIDENASGCIRKGDIRGARNCDGRQGNRESVVAKLPLIGVLISYLLFLLLVKMMPVENGQSNTGLLLLLVGVYKAGLSTRWSL
jgi:hypothetical protein